MAKEKEFVFVHIIETFGYEKFYITAYGLDKNGQWWSSSKGDKDWSECRFPKGYLIQNNKNNN